MSTNSPAVAVKPTASFLRSGIDARYEVSPARGRFRFAPATIHLGRLREPRFGVVDPSLSFFPAAQSERWLHSLAKRGNKVVLIPNKPTKEGQPKRMTFAIGYWLPT